ATHASFSEALFSSFSRNYAANSALVEPVVTINQSYLDNHADIGEYATRLKSWDWIWGQTPEFTLEYPNKVRVCVNRGKIQSLLLGGSLVPSLENKRFSSEVLTQKLGTDPETLWIIELLFGKQG
ncbi:MAG: hypothetical protein SGCHY_003523, partial [Lobulomycetales sp.]